MGPTGFEPVTSSMSWKRHNRYPSFTKTLDYGPVKGNIYIAIEWIINLQITII